MAKNRHLNRHNRKNGNKKEKDGIKTLYFLYFCADIILDDDSEF